MNKGKEYSIYSFTLSSFISFTQIIGLIIQQPHYSSAMKQVRPPTIHRSGCSRSPDPAYARCFVHRAALMIQSAAMRDYCSMLTSTLSLYNQAKPNASLRANRFPGDRW
uniref:Uncharacterized protein n=1 Tax=Opuntia streptacantha TaxID=393608 RepID=A0A7C9CRF3_OPUST